MGIETTTFAALARRFATAPMKLDAVVKKELKRVGESVAHDARLKFGTYQPAVGPYPSWAPLSPVTIRLKARAGGAEDPLIGHYPTGHSNTVWPAHLRNTIQSHVEDTGIFQDMAVHIGTADPLGRYHEFGEMGTNYRSPVPPRPFLRPAAFENESYFMRRMAIAWQETVMLL